MINVPEYKTITVGERGELPKFSEAITFRMAEGSDKKIGKVLSKTVEICPSNIECVDGQVSFVGFVTATLAFIDLEGEKRSISYVGQVDGKIYDQNITHNSRVNLGFNILHFAVDKIVGSDATMSLGYEVIGSVVNYVDYRVLDDVDGAYVEDVEIDVTEDGESSSSELYIEGDLSLGYDVSLVLATSTNAVVDKVQAGSQTIVVDGRINASIILQKSADVDEDLIVENMVLPFRTEIDSSLSTVDCSAIANVSICSCNVLVSSDEVKGKSQLEITVKGKVLAEVYKSVEIEGVVDVFSVDKELEVKSIDINTFNLQGRVEVSGDGKMSYDLDEEYNKAIGVISAQTNVVASETEEDSITLQTVTTIQALLYGDDGYRAKVFELPASIELNCQTDGIYDFDIYVVPENIECNLKLKNQLEISCNVKGHVDLFNRLAQRVISEVEIIGDKDVSGCAICVYIAKGGERLADVSRELNGMPYDIMEQNEGIVFPLEKGDKVAYYRQRKS